MKILIDFETNDVNGKPIPSKLIEDVTCFGLAGMSKGVPITFHYGDPIMIAGMLHILDICMEPYIDKVKPKPE